MEAERLRTLLRTQTIATTPDLLGLDAGTVAKGRRQLLARDVALDRVRQAGGRRTPLETKRRT